ncbi:hypothetical protein GCM10023187_45070 [Nibrella viscosa]|uniref:Uncharacterized protein n=1 Tax=Nibrella viscosa TaxID=1084524 RepID=A0ABP8KSW1_9BACT
MFLDKNYSKMTLDELVSAQQKLNSQKFIPALLIGFFVGVAIWSAVSKGSFFLTVGLLASALVIGSNYSKKQKSIEEEIRHRNSVK